MIVLIIGLVLLFNHNTGADTAVSDPSLPSEEEGTLTKASEDDVSEEGRVMVDVKGEVDEPGVYEVESDTRVNDVIKMAGGFTEKAEQATVNLAQKVQDEMIVNVPKDGADNAKPASANNKTSQMRINKASQEELEELNGIGPSKAEAIIQYREENGYFKTADDILDVSGIGDKTLESLKDDIQVP
ncbi:helix-hairpin-helix domain-containing protein [Lentibacillus kimchii]|uniref:Helix-hairpin-helix domain-containing protein n=1 Tax=Lentibacillus kimchii TaxID=1542911 RepID=A0ABW2UVW3_9BACI